MRRRSMLRLVLGPGVCFLGAACAAAAPAARTATQPPISQADEQAWEQQTYQAAKQEGKLTVYAFWNPDAERVACDFLAEHYPGVELETLTTTTATDKIRTERQSGQFLVDAYYGGATTALGSSDLGFTEMFHPPAEVINGAQGKAQPSGYM